MRFARDRTRPLGRKLTIYVTPARARSGLVSLRRFLMTPNRNWRSAAGRVRLSSVLVAAASWMAGCGGAVQTADEQVAVSESSLCDHDDNPNPQLFEVDSHPYGISMEEWAYNWLRWEYSIPAATNPAIVLGADYAQHQIRPVYFCPDGPNPNEQSPVP